jgi:hypothetical protein
MLNDLFLKLRLRYLASVNVVPACNTCQRLLCLHVRCACTAKVKCLHTQYGFWLAVQERQKAVNSSTRSDRREGGDAVGLSTMGSGGAAADAAAAGGASTNSNHTIGDDSVDSAHGNVRASSATASAAATTSTIDPLACLDGITHPVGDWIHALLLEQQANELAAEKLKA